jgi:O-antigen ligase
MFGSPVSILALTYIAVSVLSILVSRKPSNALNPLMVRFTMFALYLMIIHVCSTRNTLRLCILGFVIGLTISTLAGFYETVTAKPILEEVRWTETFVAGDLFSKATDKYRIRGLAYDPDSYSMSILVPLSFLLYFLSTVGSRRWKFLTAGVLFLVVVSIIGTASRAAWLGLVLIMAGFFVLVPLRHKPLYLLGMFGTIFASFFAIVSFFPDTAVFDKMSNVSGTGTYSTSYRADHVRISVEMGRQNLLLGAGTGNYREEFNRFYRVTHVMPIKFPQVPHNIYAAVFAENGILGLGVYSLMHLAVVLQVLACIRIPHDRDTKAMAIGVLLSFLAFAYCGNFYAVLGSKYGWTSMGFAGALGRVLRAENQT